MGGYYRGSVFPETAIFLSCFTVNRHFFLWKSVTAIFLIKVILANIGLLFKNPINAYIKENQSKTHWLGRERTILPFPRSIGAYPTRNFWTAVVSPSKFKNKLSRYILNRNPCIKTHSEPKTECKNNDFPPPYNNFFTVNRHENVDISEIRSMKWIKPPNHQTIIAPL
jgi:hypothetical protein